MDSEVLIVGGLLGFYLLVNIFLVPFQIRYLEAKAKQKEKQKDVNKRHDEQSFEESQLEYNQQAGIFFPSLLVASVMLYIKKRKRQ